MEAEKITNEDILWPRKTDFTYIGLITIGSGIAGFIGGVVTLLFIFLFARSVSSAEGIYAYLFSLGWFFTSSITVFMTLWMNGVIAPDKYRQGSITFAQVAIYNVILYICVLPLYIYLWATTTQVTYVFVAHILLSILGSSIISEILANYRYVLLGLYGSFTGFLVTSFIVVLFYINTTESQTALFGLIGVVMVGNVVTHAIRAFLEYVYYQIYKATWTDQLWDIFYQIEQEEKDAVEKARKNLETFQ